VLGTFTMLAEKEFYFIRHGQTDWNLDHRAQGQTDVPLNEKGRQQAQRAAYAARHLRFGTICSSPLSRALETAEAIAHVTGSKISVLDELKECCWGVREGSTKGVWFENWKAGSEIPDGAEPYSAFLERAVRAINRALQAPGPVLIVAHGGIYWAVQMHALKDLDADLENATIVKHTPPNERYPWWNSTVLVA
jgi:broad specificity phosphatase PhoE